MITRVVLGIAAATLISCAPAHSDAGVHGGWDCIDNDAPNISIGLIFNADQTGRVDWTWTGDTPKGAGEIRYHSDVTFKPVTTEDGTQALSIAVIDTELDKLAYDEIDADKDTFERVQTRIQGDIFGEQTSFFLNPAEDRSTDLSLILNIGKSPASLACKRQAS